MNVWQVSRQLAFVLRIATWDGGEVVFGSVAVTVRPHEDAMEQLMFPVALIRPLAADVDPEHDEEMELLQQRFAVRVMVAVAGDALGETAILGANRAVGDTGSAGRGVLEVEEELADAINRLNGIDGIEVLLRARSAVDVDPDDEVGYVAIREYLVEALTTTNRFYHAPTRFTAVGGSGSVTLAWTLPPNRFDRVRVMLRRAAGGTPPATPTSDIEVPLGTPLPTGFVDTGLAPGTFSYSLFGVYDDFGDPPAADLKFSAPISVAGVVVS